MQTKHEIELRAIRLEMNEKLDENNRKLEVVRAESQSSHLELMTWLRTRFEGYVGQPLAAVRRASGQFAERAVVDMLPRRASAEGRALIPRPNQTAPDEEDDLEAQQPRADPEAGALALVSRN